jgi:hypothetical protein
LWTPKILASYQQFHALRDLLMREFGSLAVFSLVSLAFMPDILEQNDFRREESFSVFGFGAGALSPGLPGFAAL